MKKIIIAVLISISFVSCVKSHKDYSVEILSEFENLNWASYFRNLPDITTDNADYYFNICVSYYKNYNILISRDLFELGESMEYAACEPDDPNATAELSKSLETTITNLNKISRSNNIDGFILGCYKNSKYEETYMKSYKLNTQDELLEFESYYNELSKTIVNSIEDDIIIKINDLILKISDNYNPVPKEDFLRYFRASIISVYNQLPRLIVDNLYFSVKYSAITESCNNGSLALMLHDYNELYIKYLCLLNIQRENNNLDKIEL